MSTLTITAKGQVTLRRDVLRHLGLQPGDRLEVERLPDGRIELRAARREAPITQVFGSLKRDGAPVLSIEEIGAIAAEGWAGRR
jgi:AbrB family looped-hinge helix DNA binding protein